MIFLTFFFPEALNKAGSISIFLLVFVVARGPKPPAMSQSAIAQTATAILSNLTILLASMLCLCKRLSLKRNLRPVETMAPP